MKLCDYGCGQEAKHPFKNGKWCCSESCNSCPITRKKKSESHKGETFSEERKKKISESNKGKHSKACSEKTKIKISKSKKGKKTGPHTEETKSKIGKSNKGKISHNKGKNLSIKIRRKMRNSLKDYKEKYPFFFKIEELRETKNGEIQAHCKNHECENSKEKGGWFTPTNAQLNDRIQAIEKPKGFGESNFYCSQHCKDSCILYGLQSDPLRVNILPYTSTEYQTFRTFVLERDNHICQFCGKPATHVHHERPQKLEPFYTLDPDFAWSCCEKCHYEKGHKGECSTGNLAKIVCSVESQKFLNQK